MNQSFQLSQIGRNISTARFEAGITLTELAQRCNMLPITMKKIEASEYTPSLQQLAQIANALHMSLASLVDTDSQKPGPDNPDNKPQPRIHTCRYAFPRLDGWTDCKNAEKTGHKTTCESDCEHCSEYESRYIQYPLEINGIKTEPLEGWNLKSVGSLVAVRPCSENPDDKTYLGIYLGEQPWFLSVSFNRTNKTLTAKGVSNPLIYIFETKKLVRGADSWWTRIRSQDDMRQISDQDIQNTWYVQLLQNMSKSAELTETESEASS